MLKKLLEFFLASVFPGAEKSRSASFSNSGQNSERSSEPEDDNGDDGYPTIEQMVAGGDHVYLRDGIKKTITALPENMKVREIDIADATALKQLAAGIECVDLKASGTVFESLPDDIRVSYRLDLIGNRHLTHLPHALNVDYLRLRNCTSLTRLPEKLEVFWLDVSGCTSLESWPVEAKVKGRFIARNCAQFSELPLWLRRISELDVRGWRNLQALPPDLVVTSSLDIADTGLTSIPEGCRGARIHWRGVLIDEQIAFCPESIAVSQVLEEQNVERRRVLMERMGYERFMLEAKAKVIHQDKDTRGGERKLLKVPMRGDEDLVCVSVICPSTQRNYILRVPPATRTCAEAVAWICGFDETAQYQPLMET